MGCLFRCTAKLFVIAFSLIMLAVAIATTAVGVLSVQALTSTFLAEAIPVWASATMIGVGVVLAIFSLVVLFGTACCLHKSKKSLCLMGVLTLLFTVAFSGATVVAFQYAELMRVAADKGFADNVEAGVETFYTGLRDAYVKAYVDCNATSYMTDNVKVACRTQKALPWNKLAVDECASDNYDGGTARVGLYCRNGPGLSPFTVDRVLGGTSAKP